VQPNGILDDYKNWNSEEKKLNTKSLDNLLKDLEKDE